MHHIVINENIKILISVIAICMISGCQSASAYFPVTPIPENGKSQVEPAVLIVQPVEATRIPDPTVAKTPVTMDTVSVWIPEYIPLELKNQINFPRIRVAEFEAGSRLKIDVLSGSRLSSPDMVYSKWVYTLVAPFPTILDDISVNDLKNVWQGGTQKSFGGQALFVSDQTRIIFTKIWGKPSDRIVSYKLKDEIIQKAWEMPYSWAIIPFEDLQPRWKVIRIGGISPFDKSFDADDYGLTVRFGLVGEPGLLRELDNGAWDEKIFPVVNLDPEKITSLMMTGTTAMVRHLAFEMEENGVLFPAKNINNVLINSDIIHISNEVSFDPNCPPAVPLRREARFCSDPKYFELFTHIGVDVIELTGNHNLDWGYEPYRYSLEMYNEHGIPYYGGGKDTKEAKKALLLENHGNKLAFLGCSPAGPENVWATSETPGSARCDFTWIESEIERLIGLGYLPIFTFQHFELDDAIPHSLQRVDFQKVSQMGAIIVSGSQSHFAQSMTFINNRFIHYGLGNLFFDQMDEINRRAFIDRHIFYNGRYISTELVPIILEDYALPTPLVGEERASFLTDIFEASRW